MGGPLSRALWGSTELLYRAAQIAAERRESPDATLIQREFISTAATLERFVKHPTVFDVDDALWLGQRHRFETDKIAERATLVIAGNQYLADYYSAMAKIVVLPTAVDASRYHVGLPSYERPSIGWCGQSSGFRYLDMIVEPLRRVLEARPEARFAVMADRRPDLHLPSGQMEFVPWSIEGELDFLASLSVGIMPLKDGAWERGKCSYKMLTYMASGVPVVVSPVGMNAEVLAEAEIGFGPVTEDEWTAAVLELIDRPVRALEMGRAGRQMVERQFDLEVIGGRLAEVLRSTC